MDVLHAGFVKPAATTGRKKTKEKARSNCAGKLGRPLRTRTRTLDIRVRASQSTNTSVEVKELQAKTQPTSAPAQ
ncbi:hypothetical protein M0657_007295 [Pyricularia oryzae]|uniref:Uncharacterized protein n=3 Tax=Pyricularia oryzae TaxID=318829 RepID=A0A4P7NDB1_PYROR|nr:hypothetical protein OOU_Y34scaffold00192g43 [Pyricularia oryzae Y34]KAI7919094.1 hypothetical protein M0657_007295 [Pyricularia oryzae]KAI7924946.1 hypothetical protein M9X92_003522 [Pyricularia oryzae]QBZ58930.1 hypothetical protein PoMZ_03889 [Pyricularia oryzae]